MTGREYETRNYSFEEVNHAMAEQLALVCFWKDFFLSIIAMYSRPFQALAWFFLCKWSLVIGLPCEIGKR